LGANSAIFGILDEVFLRPIPIVRHEDRLVIAVVAARSPARRAPRVDPLSSLGCE